MATNTAYAYAALEKADKNPDGTLTVYGKATDDSLDIDQQICDDEWLKRAMPDWMMSGGNVREQHSSIAAGVATEYEAKSDGHYITALVVDPVSVKKVETGVLKGFSIGIRGPRVIRDAKAAGGRIVDGQIVEISLVDRPANPNAKMTIAKAVEGGELMAVKQGGVPTPKDVFKGVVKDDVEDEKKPVDEEALEQDVAPVEDAEADQAEQPSDVPVEADDAQEDDGDVEGDDAGDADEEKREFSTEERETAAEEGTALPDGSFPIVTVADLHNAIQSVGRATDPEEVRAHIIERARALDAVDQLPESWSVEKSVKAADTAAHDELYANAVAAIVALIQAEAAELVEGEDERADIKHLLKAQKHLEKWHKREADKGEVTPVETDEEVAEEEVEAIAGAEPIIGDENDMAMCPDCGLSMKLCKCADKSATIGFDDAQIESVIEKAVASAKASVTEELDQLKAALKAVDAEKVQITEELVEAKKAIAGGGPKRSATGKPEMKVNDLLVKAADYRHKASVTLDPTLAKGYKELAADLEAKASRKDA